MFEIIWLVQLQDDGLIIYATCDGTAFKVAPEMLSSSSQQDAPSLQTRQPTLPISTIPKLVS
jgi:hypothetical protein